MVIVIFISLRISFKAGRLALAVTLNRLIVTNKTTTWSQLETRILNRSNKQHMSMRPSIYKKTITEDKA